MTYANDLGVLRTHSLPSLVQGELERMIREGDLQPGDALREVPLAAQLGVSRGPIREAFRALEEKGLVRVAKNRGVFVRSITAAEADEIYEVRAAIETLIIERLARSPERLQDAGLQALLNQSERLAREADVASCHLLNLEFHERLAELSGNAALLQVYRRLVSELSLFRQQAHARSPDASSLRRSVADHCQIHDALIAGRPREALKVLRRHVEESRQRLQKLLSDSPRTLP